MGSASDDHSDRIPVHGTEDKASTFYRTVDTFQLMPSKFSRIDEETLTQFGVLIETCMNLSEGNQLEIAGRILWSYLLVIEGMAQRSSEYQKQAASITSQGYLIAASLVDTIMPFNHGSTLANKH